MQRLCDWSVYVIVRLFVCLIQSLSLRQCEQIAGLMGWLATHLIPLRKKILEENVRQAFPQLNQAERQRIKCGMWNHLILMVCEIAHLPRKIHETSWLKHVSIKRQRELVTYLLSDRPIVVVSGHFGNFEAAGYMTGLLGFPAATIARTLDNQYLDRFVRDFRERRGQFILDKLGAAEPAKRLLEHGGMLSLLGDQYGGKKGCWVQFLGRPASSHKAIALFSLTSGAPLIVAYAVRKGKPLQFEIGLAGVADPVEGTEQTDGVRSLTQWYNQTLEELIIQYPEQYWWVHRRWKGRPPERMLRKLAQQKGQAG